MKFLKNLFNNTNRIDTLNRDKAALEMKIIGDTITKTIMIILTITMNLIPDQKGQTTTIMQIKGHRGISMKGQVMQMN